MSREMRRVGLVVRERILERREGGRWEIWGGGIGGERRGRGEWKLKWNLLGPGTTTSRVNCLKKSALKLAQAGGMNKPVKGWRGEG